MINIMAKKTDNFVYIIAIFILVIAGLVTATIIASIKNNAASQTDIRARAGVVNTLTLIGVVNLIDTEQNSMTVDHVRFSPKSRSGPEVDYGTWIVIPPRTFNLYSAGSGSQIEFVINASDFDVANKMVVASDMTLQ